MPKGPKNADQKTQLHNKREDAHFVSATAQGTHLTFHGLRHWAGRMLYRAGVPIKDIQARLGHSRWEVTANWYVEASTKGEQEAAEIAASFLNPGAEFLQRFVTNSVTIVGIESVSA